MNKHPLVKLAYILFGLAGLYYIFPYLVPFLIALILAILLEPFVLKIQKWLKVKRLFAVTTNFFIFIVTTLGLTFLILTKVTNQAIALSQQLPRLANEVGKGMESLISQSHAIFKDLPTNTLQILQEAIRDTVNLGGKISSGATALVGTAKAIPNLFVFIVVTLISFYLICLQLPDLKKGFLQLFSDSAKKKVEIILCDINLAIVGFVRAQVTISVLTYIFILVGLIILGVRYALAVALLITIVDILPLVGTGILMIPWAIVLFIINKNFMAMGILALYILVTVLRRIIEPKMLGENIGLSPLSTIISMYVGFKIIGMGGVFIGPAICIIFVAMRKTGLFHHKIDF
ncbi:MAG: sporulation integral membrane protein YtvI [bacterium]